jgi:beta-lactamase regulating signal transducer with metallopeptidase domain
MPITTPTDPTAAAAFALRLLCGLTAIWLTAGAATLLLRRRCSAALRHGVWSLSVAAALFLPALIATLPEYRVGRIEVTSPTPPLATSAAQHAPTTAPPTIPSPTAAPTRLSPPPFTPALIRHDTVTAPHEPTPATATPAPQQPRNGPLKRTALWLTVLWLLPTLWLLARHATSTLIVRRLIRGATAATDLAPVRLAALCTALNLRHAPRLLESPDIASPLCLGVLRPALLLPPAWRTWPPAQLDAVLTHELAHVARRDVLWQTLARLACALYWFHPLAWLAAARMRVDRELACDDWVLRAGEPSTRYARWLLDVAAALAGRSTPVAPCAGIAMASRTGLEHRITAILDPARRRRPVTRPVAVLLAFITIVWVTAIGTLSPLAPRRATAQAPAADPDFPAQKSIAFRVVESGTNRPVDDVKLSARVTGQRRTWTTDDDGHAKLDVDADSTSLTVWADKDGYVPMTVTWEPLRSRQPIPGEYLLQFERATTIGGRVLNEAGKPIPAVEVALDLQRKGEERQAGPIALGPRAALYDVRAKTDADGRWRFDRAPAHIQVAHVRLAHPDYLSDERFGQRPFPPHDKLRDQTAVMVMAKGLTVAGRVLTPDGQPVPGAQLSLGMTRYGLKAPTARSAPDGRFTLANCRPNQHATLIVKAGGWAPHMSQFALQDKPVADLDVRLDPPQTLRIRVLDPKGQPIPAAGVSAGRWRGLDILDWRATTAADGRVVWTEAPADEVAISASARGYIALNSDVRLKAGDAEHVVTLAPVLKVTGTVVDDETGKPVEQFRAIRGWTSKGSGRQTPHWSREEEGAEQGLGTFEYTETNHRDGYALRIEAPGYLPADSRVIAPGEENVKLQFRLKKGKALAATLRSADGKPLAGADILLETESNQVSVRNGKAGPGTDTLQTKTDAAGRFRFEPQAGEYTVLVLHDLGYAELKPDQFAAPGERTITVQPWATIRGTARVGSKPAAGQKIVAMNERGGRTSKDCSATADAEGNFVLDRVPPGPVSIGIELQLRADSQGSTITWTQRQPVTAEPGKTHEIKLGGVGRPIVGRLAPPADLAARIDWHLADVSLSSKPKAQRKLPPDWAQLAPEAREKLTREWLASPEGKAALQEDRNRRYYPAIVAPDGTFRADDVQPGDYVLSVRVEKPTSMGGSRFGGQAIASATHDFTVAPIPNHQSETPQDLGSITLQPTPTRPAR